MYEQVPLLTAMGEDERALVKALESGDTDLAYLAVFHLWRKCQFGEFVKVWPCPLSTTSTLQVVRVSLPIAVLTKRERDDSF